MALEPIYLEEDPGLFELSMLGKKVTLDTYREQTIIAEINTACGEDTNRFRNSVAGHLKTMLGLETQPSDAVASFYVSSVLNRTEEVRKKIAGLLGLPTTTDSTPSDSVVSSEQPLS